MSSYPPQPNAAMNAAAAAASVRDGTEGPYYPRSVPTPVDAVRQQHHPYYAARPLPVHVPHYQHQHQPGMMSQQQPSTPQPLVRNPPTAPSAAPAPAPVSVLPQSQRPAQQQRTDPIVVGGSSGVAKTTSKSTTNNPATAPASTANSKTNPTGKTSTAATTTTSSSSTNKFHPIGRCVGDSLAILRAYASPSSQILSSSKKRKTPQEHLNVLERLVPPLLLCAENNVAAVEDEEEGEDDIDGPEGGNDKNGKRAKTDSCDTSGDGRDDDGDNLQANGSTNAIITTTPAMSTKREYHAQLKMELAQHVHENQKLMQRRRNVFQSLVRLHELYETGLDGISRMNDLTFVPDNVMPE